MVTEILTKMLDKLVEKVTTPEDIVLMSLLFGSGILMTRLLPKYLNKPKMSENAEAATTCPLTGKKPKCEQIHPLMQELKQLQNQITDTSVRISKVMNILSKEYDGQWDRYLYDRDLSPKEGSRVKPDDEKD